MTDRDHAELARWQELRHLPPEERIEILMRDFWDPPLLSDLEYQIQLCRVAEEMACV